MERIEIVKNIVKKAGRTALDYFGRTTGSIKSDRTIVTLADIEIGKFLTQQLQGEFPGYGIINEEIDDEDVNKETPDLTSSTGIPIKQDNEYTWIIDPIDGTSSFYCRLPVWCIAVGLLKGLEPVLGMIYMPVMDEFYYTDENIPAYFESGRWGKTVMDISGRDDHFIEESFLGIISTLHKTLNVTFPGKARALGSNSANFCYVSRGDAVGAFIRGHLWDLVMGMAILKKAGGKIFSLNRKPVDLAELFDRSRLSGFNIIGSPANVEKILGITKHKDDNSI
ncbi:MAG: hypothetical protein K8T10_18050 [Candidatus Eremiobacteraeota bacterium]|nr:hypothetical protein [Candidatus Eremiobacteraeota bacterium]